MKIIKHPQWAKASIENKVEPIKPLPDWVDQKRYIPPVKMTHTHRVEWHEPEDVNCPTGMKAWPPGKHTYGGELIPCAECGCLHNLHNFGREYYPQQFPELLSHTHTIFDQRQDDKRGEVKEEDSK